MCQGWPYFGSVGAIPSQDMGRQTELALENVQQVLTELGAGIDHFVTLNCYVTDLDMEASAVVAPKIQQFGAT